MRAFLRTHEALPPLALRARYIPGTRIACARHAPSLCPRWRACGETLAAAAPYVPPGATAMAPPRARCAPPDLPDAKAATHPLRHTTCRPCTTAVWHAAPGAGSRRRAAFWLWHIPSGVLPYALDGLGALPLARSGRHQRAPWLLAFQPLHVQRYALTGLTARRGRTPPISGRETHSKRHWLGQN